MNDAIAVEGATIQVQFPEIPLSKLERERRAFYRLLPELLLTHAGQFVAIHDEKVVDSGQDQIEVALRVQRRIGALPIFVHRVTSERDPSYRSGVIRDVTQLGNDK